MYDINELLKKYPLVEKAFNKLDGDIEAAFFFIGGEEAVKNAPKQIIETIDQNIDGTDIEKQALIIAAFYSLSPGYLAADAGEFASKYDAATQAVMNDLLAYDKESVAPESVSRITAAVSICVIEATASIMAEGAGRPIPPQMQQAIKQGMLDSEKTFLPNLNAPRLEALYQASKQKLFAALDKDAAGPQPKNKKPGGPKA
jgi:hypothetical protein